MKNYKIIIILILVILLGLYVWNREKTIASLEKDILNNQITISSQDDKIKEQLSTISLLEADSVTKDAAIIGLQNLVDSNRISCQEAMDKLTELGSIVSDSTSIEVPFLNSTAGEKIIVKEVPIIKESENEENINVVDPKSGKRFIELRNNVISSYK